MIVPSSNKPQCIQYNCTVTVQQFVAICSYERGNTTLVGIHPLQCVRYMPVSLVKHRIALGAHKHPPHHTLPIIEVFKGNCLERLDQYNTNIDNSIERYRGHKPNLLHTNHIETTRFVIALLQRVWNRVVRRNHWQQIVWRKPGWA